MLKNITTNDITNIAKSDIIKFKEFLTSTNSDKIIVITHFPPVRNGTSDPKYLNNELQDYFTWDNMIITEKIPSNKIKIW